MTLPSCSFNDDFKQKAAWFYLRDPYFSETLPVEERALYTSEGAEELEKLHELKGRRGQKKKKRE